MNAAVTVIFLGALAVALLWGARIALRIYDSYTRRPDQVANDTLADAEARRAQERRL